MGLESRVVNPVGCRTSCELGIWKEIFKSNYIFPSHNITLVARESNYGLVSVFVLIGMPKI